MQKIFKFVSPLVAIALVLGAVGAMNVFADTPHTATIAISTLTDDTGIHTSPFSFSCPANPLFNPVTIAGAGSVTIRASKAGLVFTRSWKSRRISAG